MKLSYRKETSFGGIHPPHGRADKPRGICY